MSQLNLIAEVKGDSTIGYGASSIKYYASNDEWKMVLYSGGKHCGRLLFDSIEEMMDVKKLLGRHFRVLPK